MDPGGKVHHILQTAQPRRTRRENARIGLLRAHGGLHQTPISRRLRTPNSSSRIQHSLDPSPAACFCVMCRFLTSCRASSRSRCLVDVHGPSSRSAMTVKAELPLCTRRNFSPCGSPDFSPTPLDKLACEWKNGRASTSPHILHCHERASLGLVFGPPKSRRSAIVLCFSSPTTEGERR